MEAFYIPKVLTYTTLTKSVTVAEKKKRCESLRLPKKSSGSQGGIEIEEKIPAGEGPKKKQLEVRSHFNVE